MGAMQDSEAHKLGVAMRFVDWFTSRGENYEHNLKLVDISPGAKEPNWAALGACSRRKAHLPKWMRDAASRVPRRHPINGRAHFSQSQPTNILWQPSSPARHSGIGVFLRRLPSAHFSTRFVKHLRDYPGGRTNVPRFSRGRDYMEARSQLESPLAR
jgi:hypothetical protein